MMRAPPGSEYLRWAKTAPAARYDLTSSGVPYLPLSDLPVKLDDLELSGTGAYGYEPLQRAIAGRYGMDTRSCVAAMGASMANHLAMAAMLRPGDEVLIEHPTYEPLIATARYLGAEVRHFARRPESGFAVDPAEVERHLAARTRLIVLTNLHNPSSALVADSTLSEIGALARRVGARVLVDEVYLDSLFEAKPRTAFTLGDEFIAASSLTKVYGLNGLRCGWVFAEPELAERMWRLTEIFNNIGVHLAERLSLVALENLEPIAARSRTLLRANADVLNAFLRSRDDLDSIQHTAGTVSFPRVLRGDATRLCELARTRYDTAVVPGAFFGAPEHIRIGLGVDTEKLRASLERLGAALDTLR
jgi:hypothetical protein